MVQGETVTTDGRSGLTAEELFQFDQFGWLVVPAVFTPAEVDEMRQLATAWLEATTNRGSSVLPAPLEAYYGPLGNSEGGDAPGAKVIRGIYHTQYGHHLFERCAADPRIMRVVSALQAGGSCHVNQNLMQIEADTDERITFHGNLDPGDRFYAVRGGAEDGNVMGSYLNSASTAGTVPQGDRHCFSSLLNVSVSLVDVPAYEGFVSVPGSHRRGFAPSAELTATLSPPFVTAVAVGAGDALIFCEALWHSGAPWKNPLQPRLTIFSRFWALENCSEERWRSYSPENRAPYDKLLGPALRELQRQPSAQQTHRTAQATLANNNLPTTRGAAGHWITPFHRRLQVATQHVVVSSTCSCGTLGSGVKESSYTFRVTEPAGIRRYKFPVSINLDVAPREAQTLHVVDALTGEDIAVQMDLCDQGAGSCTVHFHCSLEAFETRCDYAASCNHPNIVTAQLSAPYGTPADLPCFAMRACFF